MLFFLALNIHEAVIKIYNNKDVKLFRQDFINTNLKCSKCIGQTKKYYLILKVPIPSPEGYFLFITFLDLYSMINIGLIKLSDKSNLT